MRDTKQAVYGVELRQETIRPDDDGGDLVE